MILMGSCRNTGNDHHHRPQLQQEHGLRHVISSTLVPDVIMALVGNTDLPDNMGPASVGYLHSNTPDNRLSSRVLSKQGARLTLLCAVAGEGQG